MSRVANNPVKIPDGVAISLLDNEISVKGAKGSLSMVINEHVDVEQVKDSLKFSAVNRSSFSNAMSGTTRALVNNMVLGVSKGFEKKLEINGVGYRVKVSGTKIELSLGYSHPVNYDLPEGVSAEAPSQTELVLTSSNKQLLGDVASKIRSFRPPEPYKGKGVKYSDERIIRNESKKA